MHYVIGDVHGCYDDLMVLLDKIEEMDPKAEFILVGDLVDRGPKVWETLCWAMKNITRDGKYQSVRGNHDQMAMEYIQQYERWYRNNAESAKPYQSEPVSCYDFSTVLRTNVRPTGPGKRLHPRDLAAFTEFFQSLPYHKLLKIETVWGKQVEFRVVHSYYEAQELPEGQQHESNLWERIYCGNQETEEILVHGHTPTFLAEYMYWEPKSTRPGLISYRLNDIDVDGGCVFAKEIAVYPAMLCAICLENLEEIYPYSIQERFAQISVQTQSGIDSKSAADSYNERFMKHKNPYRVKILQKMGCTDAAK